MEPPQPPPPSVGGSSGFQNASSLSRTTHAPSLSSNRNASGNLPPPPPPVPAAEASSSDAPVKPVNRPASSKNAIIYSVLQRKNPCLPLIRNVGLEIGDIVADYQVGAHNGVLFLSLKYHRLHPEYIFGRIEKMRNAYNVRIMLILCDIAEHQQPIRELSKVAIINNFTILVAFSNEEAAQYLTTLKSYEHKSADTLKEKVLQEYHSQLEHVLTSGRKVNKSNAEALAASFGSFANMVRQSNHTLGGVKGLGKVKVVSLLEAFNKPFVAGRHPKQDKGKGKALEGTSVIPAASSTSSATKPQQREAGEDTDDDDDIQIVLPNPPGNSSPDWPEEDEIPSLRGRGAPSPDWPQEEDTPAPARGPPSPEAPRGKTPPTPIRPRDTGPSRSPSVEADPERTAHEGVWHDPLEDDDDEDNDEPAAKRVRV